MRRLALVSGLLILGAGAATVWWKSGELDRSLASARGAYIDRDVLEVLARHGDDPRVQTLFRDRLQEIVLRPDYPATRLAPPIELDYLDRVFAEYPPPVDLHLRRAVAVAWFKWGHAGAVSWTPGFDRDPEATEAILWALEDLATSPDRWGDEPYELEICFDELVDELERRGVVADDRRLRASVVSVAIRYDFAGARERLAAYGSAPWLPQTVSEHLLRVANDRDYREAPGEVDRLMAELARLRPSPTDDLTAALARYSSHTATIEAATALGLDTERLQAPRRAARPTADTVEGILRDLLRRAEPDPFGPQLAAPRILVDLPLSPALGRIDWGPLRANELNRAVDRLVALGAAAVADLRLELQVASDRRRVHLAARALAETDAGALSELVRQALKAYEPLALEHEEIEGLDRPPDFAAEEYVQHGTVAAEGLGALARIERTTVEPAFLEALSSPDGAVASLALKELRRLPDSSFVPALFTYLGVKAAFRVVEVERYVESLTHRATCSPHVVRGIEELLQAHGGSPDAVPWIHKLVAMRALQEIGDPDALAVLGAYAADRTVYFYETRTVDTRTLRTLPNETVEEERSFADLVAETIASIKERSR